MEVDARVVSIYGSSAVAYAAQNQVVAINMGSQDGLEPGHVLSLLTKGDRIKDMTDSNKAMVKLPSEVNGTAMVFRTFERVLCAAAGNPQRRARRRPLGQPQVTRRAGSMHRRAGFLRCGSHVAAPYWHPWTTTSSAPGCG